MYREQVVVACVRIHAGVYFVPYRLFAEKILSTYTRSKNLNNTFRLTFLGEILHCYK